MRVILLISALISFLSPQAQTHMPGSMNYTRFQPIPYFTPLNDSSSLHQKWFVSKFGGLSAGFGYFNGGSATVLSVPLGLQLNRQLNNNLIAFAGISAAPTFYTFNGSFTNPALNKSYPGSTMQNTYGFGMNSRVEMGLMYINDEKTFSISGSIGIDRTSYPVYPAEPVNRKRK